MGFFFDLGHTLLLTVSVHAGALLCIGIGEVEERKERKIIILLLVTKYILN